MPIEIVMPRLGWNMEAGTVVEWLKHDGDPVKAGDYLFLVESDKATTEVESLDSGADGVVVSNHGGRQLDGALSSARALPRIADAIAGRMSVLADGGVRSGLDVVRMLALGADFVLLGRAWAYALAARGQVGVAHVLKLIEAEMRVAMSLTACTNIGEIDRQILERGDNQPAV